jgi:hypothetical protein
VTAGNRNRKPVQQSRTLRKNCNLPDRRFIKCLPYGLYADMLYRILKTNRNANNEACYIRHCA